MKDSCEICGIKDDTKFTVVISPLIRLDICKDCMNLYGNHRYDELIEKLKNNKSIYKM